MSLTCVNMSEDVWLTCLTHALSTEKEEIMGLLLGDIEYSKNGSVKALIWGALPQPRSDRKKDRVETNPEQLVGASAVAERMTISIGRTTRVIGWYHSHPHITVLPSHVDLRTQAMYQLLDSQFIGLIFSCFNEDASKIGRIQVIAFQSSDGKPNSTPVPMNLKLENKYSVIDLDSSSSSSARAGNPELDTSDTATTSVSKGGGRISYFKAFFVNNAEAKNTEGEGTNGGNRSSGNSSSSAVEVEPMDMSESMQEAIRLSKLETSGAGYVRKEVPLHVLPTSFFVELSSPLESYKDLQRVLYEEEKAAYHQSVQESMRGDRVHPLAFIHKTSTYHQSLCNLIEYCLSPTINALQDKLRENNIRLAMLMDEAKELEAQKLKRNRDECGTSSSGSRVLQPKQKRVVERSPKEKHHGAEGKNVKKRA